MIKWNGERKRVVILIWYISPVSNLGKINLETSEKSYTKIQVTNDWFGC